MDPFNPSRHTELLWELAAEIGRNVWAFAANGSPARHVSASDECGASSGSHGDILRP